MFAAYRKMCYNKLPLSTICSAFIIFTVLWYVTNVILTNNADLTIMRKSQVGLAKLTIESLLLSGRSPVLMQHEGTFARTNEKTTAPRQQSWLPRILAEPHKDVVCSQSTKQLIVTFSSVANINLRSVIRHTWASKEQLAPSTSLMFVLGWPTTVFEHLQGALRDERTRYNDVLQIAASDTAANLTVKALTVINWVTSNCRHLHFIVKTDDDVFLNIPLLTQALSYYSQQTNEGSLFAIGYLFRGAKPNDRRFATWYHPAHLMSNNSFPDYLSGSAYVISVPLLKEMVKIIPSVPQFWLEDIYVTGMLVKKAGGQLIHDERFHYRKVPPFKYCDYKRLISSHGLTVSDIQRIWSTLLKQSLHC